MPLPNNPLRYVLVYALAHDDGLALIDAGWDTDTAWQTLIDGIRTTGHAISDVTAVIGTHVHPDHYGLAHRVGRHQAPGSPCTPPTPDSCLVCYVSDVRGVSSSSATSIHWALIYGSGTPGAMSCSVAVHRSRVGAPRATTSRSLEGPPVGLPAPGCAFASFEPLFAVMVDAAGAADVCRAGVGLGAFRRVEVRPGGPAASVRWRRQSRSRVGGSRPEPVE